MTTDGAAGNVGINTRSPSYKLDVSGTLGVAQTATFASNITQTGGTTTLAGLSVNTISTQSINTSSISSYFFQFQTGYISSLTVDNLAIGSNYGFVNMGDIIATSMSTILIQSLTVATSNIQSYTISPGLLTASNVSTNTIYANHYYGDGSSLSGITTGFIGTATSDLNMNAHYLKDNTGNLDLSGAAINLHTSSFQQYLNFVPVPQPVIQFGSWISGAANTDGTSGPITVPITNYNNTTYCIYITGQSFIFPQTNYTAVPFDGSNFNVYLSGGDTYGCNIFYWQTMGYYGASAGPAQGSGGGGGGGGGTGH
jgi:hypothetical protein